MTYNKEYKKTTRVSLTVDEADFMAREITNVLFDICDELLRAQEWPQNTKIGLSELATCRSILNKMFLASVRIRR